MSANVPPWRSQALVTLVIRVTAGIVLIGVAVQQASGKPTVGAQIGWADWGVVGVVVIGVANGLWLLTIRQAVGRRARSLFDQLARLETVRTAAALTNAVDATARQAGTQDALVAAPGMTRFHRRACPLAAGKPVLPATRAAHEGAGRRPCGVCQPVTADASSDGEVLA